MTGNCHVRFGRGRAETHRASRKVRRTPTSLLVYGGQVEAGYEPGTSLAAWTAQQEEHASEA